MGGITLEEALKSIKDIAERHEKQIELIGVAARIERQREIDDRKKAKESGS